MVSSVVILSNHEIHKHFPLKRIIYVHVTMEALLTMAMMAILTKFAILPILASGRFTIS